jgi:hypothetical protein
MIHEADRVRFDAAALADLSDRAGALPEAPLAMPKQRLERPAPWLGSWAAVWRGLGAAAGRSEG